MWQAGISEMLSQTGWGTGFRLPIANAENLALERELEKRHRIVQLRRTELEDIAKHSERLERGTKNAADHIGHDLKFITAKCAEITAESELLQSIEREAVNLARECKSVEAVFKKTVLQNRAFINEIETKKYDVAELADLIELDRKELALIEKKAADETQIMKAIDEIGDQDSETLRKYETRYRKATAESSSMRIELDGNVALTLMMQADLDGLSERFKKLHKERGDIVLLWKDTLVALGQKDVEMNDIAEEYTNTDSLLKTCTMKSEDEHRKLNEREKFAGTSTLQLNKWDRKVMDLREEIRYVSEITTNLKDNMFNYETAISYASKEIQLLNSKCLQTDKELSLLIDKVAAAEAVLSMLRDQEQINCNKVFTAAERIRQIEILIEEEEKRFNLLEKHLEKEIIKKNQWFNQRVALDTQSMELQHDIRTVHSNLQNLVSRTKDAGMLLEKRKAMIYRIELQYINAELRYKPLLNPAQNTVRFKEQEEKLMGLKEERDQILKQKTFVSAQTNNLSRVHMMILREKGSTEKQIVALEAKSNEYRCFAKFSIKNLDIMVGEYQSVVVDYSLLKLKHSQLLKLLRNTKTMLYDSDSQRSLLQAAVKEKRSEVESHSRLLELKRRGAKDDLAQLKIQVCQVLTCVDKRKTRYDIIMQLMGRQEAGEGNSEAFYVLQMAQERETLLMEAQKWKTRMADAEKEIEGMSNVHMIMNVSNTSLKDSLSPAGEESQELIALEKMNVEEQEVLLRRSRAKKYRTILRDKVNELEQKTEVVDQEIRATVQFSEMKEALASKVHNELQRQRDKVIRWSGLCNKIIKEIKPLFPENQFNLLQSDLKLRFTVSKFESAIGMLERLMGHHPHVKQYFIRRLQGEDSMMKLYDRFSQSLTMSSFSTRSSTSSSSSSSSSPVTSSSPTPGTEGGQRSVRYSTSTSGSEPDLSTSTPTERKQSRKLTQNAHRMSINFKKLTKLSRK